MAYAIGFEGHEKPRWFFFSLVLFRTRLPQAA